MLIHYAFLSKARCGWWTSFPQMQCCQDLLEVVANGRNPGSVGTMQFSKGSGGSDSESRRGEISKNHNFSMSL